jgi:hypothetical protein
VPIEVIIERIRPIEKPCTKHVHIPQIYE